MTPTVINVAPETLQPFIEATVEATVEATIAKIKADEAALGGKLAFPEPEAAAMLSLTATQLRDLRLREEIQASYGPCRRVLYSRQQLLDFLANRRWTPTEGLAATNRRRSA